MINLNRPYLGYQGQTNVQFPTSTEQALAAQGFGTINQLVPTPGNVTVAANVQQGRVGIAAAGTSVVVTHPAVTQESKVFAVIEQATADGTATHVARVVCGPTGFTIFLNAAATAAVTVGWALFTASGVTSTN